MIRVVSIILRRKAKLGGASGLDASDMSLSLSRIDARSSSKDIE